MDNYLFELNEKEAFPALKEYALNNKVPIIYYDALLLIKSFLRLMPAARVLEIGTAIGYSALHFSSVDKMIKIDTIERDPSMIELARANFLEYDKSNQIKLFENDALLDDVDLKDKYDLIFIDASKAHHQEFFLKYERYLKPEGIIIIDNVFFHGLVIESSDNISKRLKPMVNKIDHANHWLASLKDYHASFFNIGDGLAIMKRCK